MTATRRSHETARGIAHRAEGAASPTTVADVMVATLKASGVRRVYGLPGDSINGFTDALRRDGGVAWEHVRHEEAAAFAAAGEAGMTGQLAVCAASCGPGNLHLVLGGCEKSQQSRTDFSMGERVPVGQMTYSVVESTWRTQLGESFKARTPEQRFLLIKISVTNGTGKDVSIPLLTASNAKRMAIGAFARICFRIASQRAISSAAGTTSLTSPIR